jgi:hypothetical protein
MLRCRPLARPLLGWLAYHFDPALLHNPCWQQQQQQQQSGQGAGCAIGGGMLMEERVRVEP